MPITSQIDRRILRNEVASFLDEQWGGTGMNALRDDAYLYQRASHSRNGHVMSGLEEVLVQMEACGIDFASAVANLIDERLRTLYGAPVRDFGTELAEKDRFDSAEDRARFTVAAMRNRDGTWNEGRVREWMRRARQERKEADDALRAGHDLLASLNASRMTMPSVSRRRREEVGV